MTPTLATIRFESAYLLCHVNAIDAHPMRVQFNSLRMRIETRLQQASCERALNLDSWLLDLSLNYKGEVYIIPYRRATCCIHKQQWEEEVHI